MKKEYVAGFLFTPDKKEVVLVKKNRPEWQKDSWNGVGGKIEIDETPINAMTREFEEETGVLIENWVEFASISGNDWKVYFFKAYDEKATEVITKTDEEIKLLNIQYLKFLKIIPNLHWLIPMANSDPNHLHAVTFAI